MRAALLLLLLVTFITIKSVAAGKNKKEKNKPSQSECTDWRYGNCVANNMDCGPGFREGSCDQQTMQIQCNVPCNWRREFGADCKYRFGAWGKCDLTANRRTRTGTFKRALFNGVKCEQKISVFRGCRPRPQTKGETACFSRH
ncbi:hypothetical protein PAMP_016421 [Pampus punctatissimus]